MLPLSLLHVFLFQLHECHIKKAHKSPFGVLTSFFQYIMIGVSSLIEAFYSTEDILSKEVFVIIEKIHHLTDRRLIVGLNLNQAKNIQRNLSDQSQIIPGSPGW